MKLFTLITILLSMVGSLSAQGNADTRTFYLGFTPFPYEISLDGLQFAYGVIENDADIVAHHFDNGIPCKSSSVEQSVSSVSPFC